MTRIIISVFVLLVLLTLLVFGVSANRAQKQNLIPNGSFERGVKDWRVFGDANIVGGVCGANAAALRGTLQSKTVRVKIGHTYRVSFRYRGDALRATVLMDLPPASSWAQMSYTFVPTYKRAAVAFEGTGEIDCVHMSAE